MKYNYFVVVKIGSNNPSSKCNNYLWNEFYYFNNHFTISMQGGEHLALNVATLW